MFHCFTFFLVIRFCILRLSLNTPALCPLFHGVSPQGEEKFYQPFVWDNMVGSPPRGRGKAPPHAVKRRPSGITPAWAGKSVLDEERRVDGQDHPRVGGEKAIMSPKPVADLGSPPRGRGKVMNSLASRMRVRITPAWAGKSGSLLLRSPPRQDHPRVGGEKRHTA